MMSKSLYLPESSGFTTVFMVIDSPGILLLYWLVPVNLIAFLIFGLDKWKAKRKAHNAAVSRIPEKTLFLLAILGGSPGALLGMRIFHHKTLHKTFRFGIPAILVLQLAAALGLWLLVHAPR